MNIKSSDKIVLLNNELPMMAKIEITTEGGWPKELPTTVYPSVPALLTESSIKAQASAELPDSLKSPFAVLSEMKRLLTNEPGADYERAFITAAIESCEDARLRVTMDPGPGYFRPITEQRKVGINQFYEKTALAMYKGFSNRMAGYAEKGTVQQKRVSAIFSAQSNISLSFVYLPEKG